MKRKKALILAGGLGTRLRPLTFAIPKPLIPVRGKPIIDYILSRLLDFGYSDIFVSLNYRADIIRLYIAEKQNRHVKIRFFEESQPLGTAGPLSFFKKNEIKLSRNESVLVINGDILTDLDFKQLFFEHDKSRADLTVAVIDFSTTLAYGVLYLDDSNNIKGVKEKPTMHYNASAGIYLMKKRVIDLVPDRYFTMPELIEISLKNSLSVKGHMIKSHWLAIEQIKNIEEVSNAKKGDWISKL